jgi:hypothetical protein
MQLPGKSPQGTRFGSFGVEMVRPAANPFGAKSVIRHDF